MCVLVSVVLCSCECERADSLTINSPDGRVSIKFALKQTPEANEVPCYSVSFNGQAIITESPLGIEFKDSGLLMQNLVIKDVSQRTIDESYTLPFGKRTSCRDYCREGRISLAEKAAPKRKIDLFFRAYNDGVAFRYGFPRQQFLQDFVITDEHTGFRFAGNWRAYTTSKAPMDDYENTYVTYELLSRIPHKTIFRMPLLLEHDQKVWVAITEANLTDYAGMSLEVDEQVPNQLKGVLTGWPEDPSIKVKATAPHRSPWRVLMIADDPGRLLESDIILNLNEPCALADTTWIKPGKQTWGWWNGNVVKGADFETGMNYKTYKHYIDFCARNKIEYCGICEEGSLGWFGEHEKNNCMPKKGVNTATAIPQLRMDELAAYAQNKGVGLTLWFNCDAFMERSDECFANMTKWGVKGFMFDFIDGDHQKRVNMCHELLKLAAEHKMFVIFHGAYKPTGICRTYPHLLNQEGVRNLEYNKWSKEPITPEHNLTVAFTRMPVGPMDYHQGGFRSVPPSEFQPRHNPVVIGTRCHHLAMYVVYENYLQMVCDYPAAYEGQLGFDLIRRVPTTWDDIRVINAKVGEYITVARKKGAEWYVASMTSSRPRELKIPLAFLSGGEYVVEIWSDASQTDKNLNHLVKQTIESSASDTIVAKLAPGGGHVMHIRPK